MARCDRCRAKVPCLCPACKEDYKKQDLTGNEVQFLKQTHFNRNKQ